jgi:putative FmdB family regulatory protein
MSSYDLRCRSCGKEFEVFVRGFLKDEAKVCPDCGAREVEQRFTGFGGVTGLGAASQSCFSGCQPSACSTSPGFS